MSKLKRNIIIISTLIALIAVTIFFIINNSSTPSDSSNTPVAVYNNAYQENYEVDSIDMILNEASDAYVLLDSDGNELESTIAALKTNENMVSAYISIGTGEIYRDDFELLKPFLAKKPWNEWTEEYFVSEITPDLISIMKKRIDIIADTGFTWIEFDNMDWAFDDDLRNKYELNVTEEAAIDYYNELCVYVHSLDLKCMAKNTTYDANMFDGVTYESYPDEKDWWEEEELSSFLDDNKLGIVVHYNESYPQKVYDEYKNIYGPNLSFIVESDTLKKYVHFNKKDN